MRVLSMSVFPFEPVNMKVFGGDPKIAVMCVLDEHVGESLDGVFDCNAVTTLLKEGFAGSLGREARCEARRAHAGWWRRTLRKVWVRSRTSVSVALRLGE